jgi:hypothetical protein
MTEVHNLLAAQKQWQNVTKVVSVFSALIQALYIKGLNLE